MTHRFELPAAGHHGRTDCSGPESAHRDANTPAHGPSEGAPPVPELRGHADRLTVQSEGVRTLLTSLRHEALKDIDRDLPQRALVVITGPSGSGKSSLALDTLFTEGQRRYGESLPTCWLARWWG